jgi:hypothetical protein
MREHFVTDLRKNQIFNLSVRPCPLPVLLKMQDVGNGSLSAEEGASWREMGRTMVGEA